MANKELGIGVEFWVVRRYQCAEITDYVDGPFQVVGFDRDMVYAIREGANSGEFFPTSEVALEREAAEENLERSKTGQ